MSFVKMGFSLPMKKLSSLDKQFVGILKDFNQNLDAEELVEVALKRHVEWRRKSFKLLFKSAENGERKREQNSNHMIFSH